MNQEIPRKRTTRFTRAARILKRTRDGFAYDDVAREEKVAVRRVQQIVADEMREAGATQLAARPGYAMEVASEALTLGRRQGDRAVRQGVPARPLSGACEAGPRRRRTPAEVAQRAVARIRGERPGLVAAGRARGRRRGGSPAGAEPARAAYAPRRPARFFSAMSAASD